MLDPFFSKALKSPLDAAGAALLDRHVEVHLVTWAGFGVGLVAGLFAGLGWTAMAFVALALNRLAAGLDGAMSRASKGTDFGAYLDLVLDPIVFSAVAAGFALAEPANKIPGIVLMIALAGTGVAALALQMFAARHGVGGDVTGPNSTERPFFYVGACVEGSEIAIFFLIALIWPHAFSIIGWLFAIACGVTIAQRVFQARAAFGEDEA